MKKTGRLALSLAEVLLFSGLAVLVGGVAVELYTRGAAATDEIQKAILVQQDIRAITEYLTRDMNAAYWVLDLGSGARDHGIALVKYASDSTRNRLAENLLAPSNRYDYPYMRQDSTVKNRIDAYLVTYRYDENEQTVSRKEEKGIFWIGTTTQNLSLAQEYGFESDSTVSERVLGKNIKQFDIHYFGYERKWDSSALPGSLKKVWDLKQVENLPDSVKVGRTACILLHLKGLYDEGVYSESMKGRGHRAPETEIVTKIWSYPRIRDEMYHEYFSSVDWNLIY